MVKILEHDSLDEILAHPLTASVFLYLRVNNRPIGVREIQRALNLGSSSTAYWHLNKLLNKGIVKQLQGSKYIILEPYSKIRKVPMTVVLDHYIFAGKAVPGIFLLLTVLGTTSIAVFVMLLSGWWIQAAFTGFFSLVVTTLLVFHFLRQFIKK
ncbi:MAG: hypothetical protein ACFFBD_02710 [Candidatus Hodarchaeota archaeon]